MSGFFAVNSLVRPCIRIMSPLFTVAMVRVVSATAGMDSSRTDAPQTAPRTCFTVTSLRLALLSICPRVGRMFNWGRAVVKQACGCFSNL
ncbi:hypothetical protein ACVWXO_009780 [Bradyrhizobium sp. LM2.7]